MAKLANAIISKIIALNWAEGSTPSIGTMRYKRYTEEDVRNAVASSTSIRQCLTKLNLKEAGGNYKSIKTLIEKLKIDSSHLTGKGWRINKTFPPRRKTEEYLENKFPINSNDLRKRLLKENILPYICDCCKKTKWLDGLIPLELHHKDGNSINNNLSNLQLLCPNCHSQTDNYRSKNRK